MQRELFSKEQHFPIFLILLKCFFGLETMATCLVIEEA